jgi:murein DD-endopeptidase MepM/ murein hydrolase activator NlpD
VAYRAYIKKDYKPVVRWVPDQPRYRRIRPRPLVLGMAVSVGLALAIISPDEAKTHVGTEAPTASSPSRVHIEPSVAAESSLAIFVEEWNEELEVSEVSHDPEPVAEENWTSVTVRPGDNLSIIFERLGLSSAALHAMMASGTETRSLARLYPGQSLRLRVEEGELLGLRFEPSVTELLEITRGDDGFTASVMTHELETRVSLAEAEISSSLFLAGQAAGLSDRLIMQMVDIYGWDIDFALDIRERDSFRVLYEEKYRDGVKVGEGPILAAEFTNRGKTFRAVRYTPANGRADYFADSGAAMRKAFLRTPLTFTRISSHFNLRRKHPVLNTIRAHRGVDYAAPGGTPIKATGDGTVVHIGNKGGYGRTVILRHGNNYSTLYAHMSRYAGGLRQGGRVKQGDVIGFVGMSGLATGPHLHYEFQVNGIHRNPLTVDLPQAEGIPESQLARFKSETSTLLAQLDGGAPYAAGAVAMREDAEGDLH